MATAADSGSLTAMSTSAAVASAFILQVYGKAIGHCFEDGLTPRQGFIVEMVRI